MDSVDFLGRWIRHFSNLKQQGWQVLQRTSDDVCHDITDSIIRYPFATGAEIFIDTTPPSKPLHLQIDTTSPQIIDLTSSPEIIDLTSDEEPLPALLSPIPIASSKPSTSVESPSRLPQRTWRWGDLPKYVKYPIWKNDKNIFYIFNKNKTQILKVKLPLSLDIPTTKKEFLKIVMIDGTPDIQFE